MELYNPTLLITVFWRPHTINKSHLKKSPFFSGSFRPHPAAADLHLWWLARFSPRLAFGGRLRRDRRRRRVRQVRRRLRHGGGLAAAWRLGFLGQKQNIQEADLEGITLEPQGVPSWELTYPRLKGTFESMIFLFQRWDMLVPWRGKPFKYTIGLTLI